MEFGAKIGHEHTCALYHGSVTRGQQGCSRRPAVTFVNCVYNIKMSQ